MSHNSLLKTLSATKITESWMIAVTLLYLDACSRLSNKYTRLLALDCTVIAPFIMWMYWVNKELAACKKKKKKNMIWLLWWLQRERGGGRLNRKEKKQEENLWDKKIGEKYEEKRRQKKEK